MLEIWKLKFLMNNNLTQCYLYLTGQDLWHWRQVIWREQQVRKELQSNSHEALFSGSTVTTWKNES